MSAPDPNPYSAPTTDSGKPVKFVELAPGEAWPPICFRCGLAADQLPVMRINVLKGGRLGCLGLAIGLIAAHFLREKLPPLAIVALVVAVQAIPSVVRARLDLPLPHCSACAAKALRAQRWYRVLDPVAWLLIAGIWVLPDALNAIAWLALIGGAIATRKLLPRRLLVLQTEPTLRIGHLDPPFAARIGSSGAPPSATGP